MSSQSAPPPRTLTQSLLVYRGMLYGFIFSLVRDVVVAEDIFQEVAVVAIEKERKADEVIREPAQWLKEVARRIVHAGFRTRQGKVVSVDPKYLEEATEALGETSVEEQRARMSSLGRCLERVSEYNRELLRRRFVVGASFEEIGKELNRRPGSLRVIMHRVQRDLADCMQERLAAEG